MIARADIKSCTKCWTVKPYSEFGRHARNVLGLQSRCKVCIRADSLVRKGGGRLLAQRAERAARPDESYCAKCHSWKPIELFSRSNRGVSGRESYCKLCVSHARVARYQANPQPEKEKARIWRQNNLAAKAADLAAYRARKMQAMPGWANKDAIARFYDAAALLTKMSGEPWHVDHIVPLRGKTASGLHVETNLQLLLGSENQSKGNKMPDFVALVGQNGGPA